VLPDKEYEEIMRRIAGRNTDEKVEHPHKS
jgi:hypothetical protein